MFSQNKKKLEFSSLIFDSRNILTASLKLFGEEHADTASSYESLGLTQHDQGDFCSALQSKQHALDIRTKLFGEEHADTARSYQSLGVTLYKMGDFPSAHHSEENVLEVRIKLFGEEHADTASSYESLGVTQHDQGDFPSALQSKQHALDIRIKLFGEEHADTASSMLSQKLDMLMCTLGTEKEDATLTLMMSLRDFVRDGSGTNSEVSREVGLTLWEAFEEADKGNFDRAVDILKPLRYDVANIGGSNAQNLVTKIQVMARYSGSLLFSTKPL
ncbi:Kinesin light chain [Stylophora pistillata]|uniref:Kinesin light chain n=1 Tax=Stylophora pistillata TaxID=50429 RepID=A0A2B4R669_STYPI|nr:Kinesin light chain [Stylophora pistillata]